MATLPRDIDIFGDDPYGLNGGTPRPPTVKTGPSVRDPTGTRRAVGPIPTSLPQAPEPTPTTQTPTPGAAAGAFSQPALWSYLQQFPHTPAGLQAAYAQNPALFGGGVITGSKGDKVRLPNGQVIDLIQSAGTGGTGWQWMDAGQSTAGLQDYFTDPTQRFLLGGVDARLQQLQQLMQSQPNLDQITGLVNQAVGQWAGPQVKPESFQAAIQALSRALGEPKPENAQLPQVTQNLRSRIGQLRGDPYSAGDEAALRAQAFDQLERDRTAAKARILEELGARGHAATSGVVARALQAVDQQFDAHRAKNTNQMALSEMQLRESRGGAADQLELALANLGGIDQQAEMQWKQQQLQAGMNAAQLDMAWQQEVNRRMQAALTASGTLSGLQTGQWAAQNALGSEAYQVSQAPYQMGLSSMSAANNILSGQPSAQDLLAQYGGLSGMTSQTNQQNANYWSQLLAGLGQLLGGMNWGGGGSSGGGP